MQFQFSNIISKKQSFKFIYLAHTVQCFYCNCTLLGTHKQLLYSVEVRYILLSAYVASYGAKQFGILHRRVVEGRKLCIECWRTSCAYRQLQSRLKCEMFWKCLQGNFNRNNKEVFHWACQFFSKFITKVRHSLRPNCLKAQWTPRQWTYMLLCLSYL